MLGLGVRAGRARQQVGEGMPGDAPRAVILKHRNRREPQALSRLG